MAYALSFADAFLWGDGTVRLEDVEASPRPRSVFQALVSLPDPDWARLAREVFEIDPDRLDIETVLLKIVETNTCANLCGPVHVWIDPDGFHTVLVYE